MREQLKRALPQWLLYFLSRFIWDPPRRAIWKQLDLKWKLRSGLTVRLAGGADWEIYNEILVNGEYDEAIQHALSQNGAAEMRVVDLGANVGYFVLRFADLFLQKFGEGRDFSLAAVEGSPQVFAELDRRIASEPLLQNRVRLINGLVGERSGSTFISEGTGHYGNAISEIRRIDTTRVEYVDLLELFGPDLDIDFLKCDIEGAEFAFIRNYTALLKRVRVAVFEFHHYGEDVAECRARLHECGLDRISVLRETPTFTIELYGRQQGAPLSK
ncbi:MAG: FkbM family methyltransferase [Terrimicrobiaceae bacterium]|nr:FkbM family methyltransferase [Terrimicrobiaceae bacterium]